jgi:Adenosine deaminase
MLSEPGIADPFLSLIFGDLELLGSDALLRDNSTAGLYSLSDVVWTEVLASRFPDVVHPALCHDIRRTVDLCGGDVLRLLKLTADAAKASTSRFPLHVFAQKNYGMPLGRALNFDVADAHLHSGASMPFELFLEGLSTRTTKLPSPENSASLRVPSPTGRIWDTWVLLISCRWALRLMWSVENDGRLDNPDNPDHDQFDDAMIAAVLKGEFWSKVRRMAIGASSAESIQVLNRNFADRARSPSLARLFWKFSEVSMLSAKPRRRFLFGFIRIIVALKSVMTSRPGEGLSRFVERFERLGYLKDGLHVDAPFADFKAELVKWTLYHTAPTDRVVGAELRKTIRAVTNNEFKADVQASIGYHNAGFNRFAKERRCLSLTMPVGFSRYPSVATGYSEAEPLSNLDPQFLMELKDRERMTELKHVLAGCEALRQLYIGDHGPLLMRSIWSIDVAGDEIGSANWPFCIGAEILALNKLPLAFTIHAGETFSCALNGIRRVGELFLGAVRPRRIGHALALSQEASASVLRQGHPPVTKADAIMDLAWLIAENIGDTGRASMLLARITQPVESKLFIGPMDWAEAFMGLHRVSPLSLLVLHETSGGTYSITSLEDRFAFARSGRPSYRAAAALSWSAPPEIAGFDIDGELGGEVLTDYVKFGDEVSSQARKHVLGLVKSHSVIIESCPTSNIRIAGLGSASSHPFWEWARKGIPVSVSSDDPLVFDSTVVDEFGVLIDVGRNLRAVRAAAKVSVRACNGGKVGSVADFQTIAALFGPRREWDVW